MGSKRGQMGTNTTWKETDESVAEREGMERMRREYRNELHCRSGYGNSPPPPPSLRQWWWWNDNILHCVVLAQVRQVWRLIQKIHRRVGGEIECVYKRLKGVAAPRWAGGVVPVSSEWWFDRCSCSRHVPSIPMICAFCLFAALQLHLASFFSLCF